MFDKETALIIVDVQHGFINSSSEKIIDVIEEIQPLYQHVVVTRFFNEKESVFRTLLNWHEVEKDSDDYQLAFTPSSNVVMFDKSGYSSYTADLEKWLSFHGIKKIHVCGINTEVCVLLTASDLFIAGYKTIILEEASASTRGRKFHEGGLTSLQHILGNHSIKSCEEIFKKRNRENVRTSFDCRPSA